METKFISAFAYSPCAQSLRVCSFTSSACSTKRSIQTQSAVSRPSTIHMHAKPNDANSSSNSNNNNNQDSLSNIKGLVGSIQRLLGLQKPSRNSKYSLLEFDPSSSPSEFENEEDVPVVLVVGATGRTGQIVVRKLLLRGFKVRVLVRDLFSSTLDKLPSAVDFVKGDLRDPVSRLQDYLSGVDKVVCLVGARSEEEMEDVELNGLQNLIEAFHNVRVQEFGATESTKITLFKFTRDGDIDYWEQPKDEVGERLASAGLVAKPPRVKFFLNEKKNAVFLGKVFEKYNGVAEVFVEPEVCNLRGFSGLIMRVIGDGKMYTVGVTSGEEMKAQGIVYRASFKTEPGKWLTVRLPFSSFVPTMEKQPQLRVKNAPELDRSDIRRISMQYCKPSDKPTERKSAESAAAAAAAAAAAVAAAVAAATVAATSQDETTSAAGAVNAASSDKATTLLTKPAIGDNNSSSTSDSSSNSPNPILASAADEGRFYLAMNYMKAYRTQEEPDFVLVSTAQLTQKGFVYGSASSSMPVESNEHKQLWIKWKAEQKLRNSGLTYCIIRAGEFSDEEGGKRPLLFEQDRDLEDENQIRSVARADIAEVCVRSLLDPRACNIAFDAFEGNFAPTSTTPNVDLSLLFERLKPNT